MKNGPNHTKTTLILGLLVLALVVSLASNAPQARANALSDLWNRIIQPFSAAPSSPTTGAGASPAPVVPLYKPALDYEQAVVAAVQKASPAVVSIIISKNVPIIDQCSADPFGNLPPEFRQFFGTDQQNLTQPCDTRQTQLHEIDHL